LLQGRQTIRCYVESCEFNESEYCTLKEIEVSPSMNIDSGDPEDESLCASYRPRY
jgi:hypothetical protein